MRKKCTYYSHDEHVSAHEVHINNSEVRTKCTSSNDKHVSAHEVHINKSEVQKSAHEVHIIFK